MSQQPYQPLPPGYQSGYQPSQQTAHNQTGNVVVVQQPVTRIVSGGCRACGGGVIEESFTVLGICLAIWFFPIGLLCCFLLMEKRCSNCGIVYS